MNPNDQTGIFSSILDASSGLVPESVTLRQRVTDPLLQGIGNIPRVDVNQLIKQRQQALEEFAPPVRTAEQIQTELQDIYGADPTSARNARFAALGQFGGDLAASQAPNIFQAFTQAAPAFSQNLANIRAKERAFQQQLALESAKTARAEKAARRAYDAQITASALDRASKVQDAILTQRLKVPTRTPVTLQSVKEIDLLNEVPPVQGYTERGKYYLADGTPAKDYIEVSSEAMGVITENLLARQQDNQIKTQGQEIPITIFNADGSFEERNVLGGPKIGGEFVGVAKGTGSTSGGTGNFARVDEVYPAFNYGKASDFVETETKTYANVINIKKPYKTVDENGQVITVDRGRKVIPNTDAHLRVKQDGSQVNSFYDLPYVYDPSKPRDQINNGQLFSKRLPRQTSISTLTSDTEFKEAQQTITRLENTQDKLDEILQGKLPFNDDNLAETKLVGIPNALQAAIVDTGFANIASLFAGDENISDPVRRKVNLELELLLKDFVKATALSPKIPVFEQVMGKEQIGADDVRKIFGDVTTPAALQVARQRISLAIAQARSAIAPADQEIYYQGVVPSFRKNDPGLVDFGVNEVGGINFSLAVIDNFNTQSTVGTVVEAFKNSQGNERDVFKNRFVRLSRGTVNSINENAGNFDHVKNIQRILNGGERIRLRNGRPTGEILLNVDQFGALLNEFNRAVTQ